MSKMPEYEFKLLKRLFVYIVVALVMIAAGGAGEYFYGGIQ